MQGLRQGTPYPTTSLEVLNAPTSGAAELFADRNYAGASASVSEGAYNIKAGNTVSSLRVAAGYAVTAYTEPDGGGTNKAFTTDTPYVGEGFTTIRSVNVTNTMRRIGMAAVRPAEFIILQFTQEVGQG